ncbi:DUF4242 domain-containing protein [Tamlana fucoidanivorans]|nr:nickel-binding protein [Tamlana fucoidanivorans]
MDRHDLPGVKLQDAAKAHKKDLIHQNEFNCKVMTYWIDEERENVFCLIEAPNKEAVQELHRKAHGLVPHKIIEVDAGLVKSFLGRIQDPEPEISPMNSAHRTILVIKTPLITHTETAHNTAYQTLHANINLFVNKFNGVIISNNTNCYLTSFSSAKDGLYCASNIVQNAKFINPKPNDIHNFFSIGMATGDPVTAKNNLFEDTINLAQALCELAKGDLVISRNVNEQISKHHLDRICKNHLITYFRIQDETFLLKLHKLFQEHYNNSEITVDFLSRDLGYSKSQLYRKTTTLTGRSPNILLRSFRLNKALKALYSQKGNISEIAFETGFNSLAYFSKCFKNNFGILPSEYIHGYLS